MIPFTDGLRKSSFRATERHLVSELYREISKANDEIVESQAENGIGSVSVRSGVLSMLSDRG